MALSAHLVISELIPPDTCEYFSISCKFSTRCGGGDSTLLEVTSRQTLHSEVLVRWRWASQRLWSSLEGRGQATQAQPKEYIIATGRNVIDVWQPWLS